MKPSQIEFPYVKEAVGAVVVVTVSIFVLALFQADRLREWFDPGATLTIVLPEAGLFGLRENADVEILGTKAGDVESIVIDPSERIHAVVKVRRGMQDFVRVDSVAIIRKRFGVAGESYLEISRGHGRPLDWEFAVLNAVHDRNPTETVGDLINEVRTKLFPVIEDAGQGIQALTLVANDLYDPEGPLQQLLANLNTITGTVLSGEGTLGYLFAQDALVRELETSLTLVNDDLERLGPILDELHATAVQVRQQSDEMPVLTERAKSVLVSLDAVLGDLRETTPELPGITRSVGAATEELPILIAQTRQTVLELEKLLAQLRQSWLLSGGASSGQRGAAGSGRIAPLEVRP